MTLHQLGQDDEARLELASARRILDCGMQKVPSADLGRWMEWVEARSLLREATMLIEGGPVPAPESVPDSKTNPPTGMSKSKRIALVEFLQAASALLVSGL